MPVPPNSTLNKRTVAERERDVVTIGDLCIKGWSYTKISDWFKANRPYQLSRAQICLDAKKAVHHWQEQAAERIDTIKARDLARLAAVESEAWNAWEASRKQSKRQLDEEISEPEAQDAGKPAEAPAANVSPALRRLVRKKSSVITENRDGDPRFLQIVFDCIQQRGLITGYTKPQLIPLDGDEKIKRDEEKEIEQALRIAYGPKQLDIPVQSTVTAETATGTTPSQPPAKAPDWITVAEAQK